MDIAKKIYIELAPDFVSYEKMEPGSSYCVIKFDDFCEHSYMSSSSWSIDDYKKQWKLAFDRLNAGQTACFVVNFQPYSCLIAMWIAYIIEDKLHIQNQYYFGKYYRKIIGKKPFTPENSFNFIPNYETHTEDNEKISEWVVDLA